MTCSICKFWTGDRDKPKSGHCFRYPPATAGNALMKMVSVANPQGSAQPIPIFALPETTGEHWCGEFIPAIVQ